VHRIAADLRLLQDRLHPADGGGIATLGQPAKGDRQPPDHLEPHLLHEQAEHHRGELPGQHQRLAGQPGREVVERVAGDQHDSRDACGAVADEQLNESASGVISNHGDVAEIHTIEEFRDKPRHPA
jgi:hypothetical protein